MTGSAITQRARAILKTIAQQEQQSHRAPGSVTLIAVSKQRSVQDIQDAYAGGIFHFGESYVQEARIKQPALTDYPLIWHFIGPIQRNKVAYIAQHFSWVHSVDRLLIAQKLQEHCAANHKILNVCLQVNLEQEATKSGLHPAQLLEFVPHILAMSNLRLRGLMCIPKPKPQDHPDQSVLIFQQLHDLLQQLKQTVPDLERRFDTPILDTLSMGMSSDFYSAINAGSTMVRLGHALFSPANEEHT